MRLALSQAGVRWEKHRRAGNPCCNPPRAAAGERLPKITLRGFQVEKKRRKSHQRKTRSLRAGQHELTDQNTARLSEEEQEEVVWRWDALPQAASLQGSQDSALPRAPVSSTKENGEMEPGYLSPCAARA